MVTLKNVIDIRTGKFHPIARVSDKNVKYFKPAEDESESELEKEEETE